MIHPTPFNPPYFPYHRIAYWNPCVHSHGDVKYSTRNKASDTVVAVQVPEECRFVGGSPTKVYERLTTMPHV